MCGLYVRYFLKRRACMSRHRTRWRQDYIDILHFYQYLVRGRPNHWAGREGDSKSWWMPSPIWSLWYVHHMDLKFAELSDKSVYRTTLSYQTKVEEGKVYKFKKALYRLKQAPSVWNLKLDQNLVSLVFKRCPLELQGTPKDPTC